MFWNLRGLWEKANKNYRGYISQLSLSFASITTSKSQWLAATKIFKVTFFFFTESQLWLCFLRLLHCRLEELMNSRAVSHFYPLQGESDTEWSSPEPSSPPCPPLTAFNEERNAQSYGVEPSSGYGDTRICLPRAGLKLSLPQSRNGPQPWVRDWRPGPWSLYAARPDPEVPKVAQSLNLSPTMLQ